MEKQVALGIVIGILAVTVIVLSIFLYIEATKPCSAASNLALTLARDREQQKGIYLLKNALNMKIMIIVKIFYKQL